MVYDCIVVDVGSSFLFFLCSIFFYYSILKQFVIYVTYTGRLLAISLMDYDWCNLLKPYGFR